MINAGKSTVLIVGQAHKTIGGIGSVTQLMSETLPNHNIRVLISDTTGFCFGVFGALNAMVRILLTPPDFVHLQLAVRGSLYRKLLIAKVAHSRKIPIVVHLHGHNYNEFVASRKIHWYFSTVLFSVCDAIIVLGKFWESFIIKAWPQFQTKVRVVPNAVPANEFVKARKKVFLFVGEVGSRKGAFELLDAFCTLEHRDGWTLKFAGPGNLKLVSEYVEAAGLESQVEILGPQSREQVQELLAESSVLVLPSKGEGLPMAILEALASGLPVIATDVGSVGDAVKNYQTGLLIETKDLHLNLTKALDYFIHEVSAERYELYSRCCLTLWNNDFAPSRFSEAISQIYRDLSDQRK